MKEIYYTEHLKFRMKIRDIPEILPEQIYKEAKERYYDRETSHYIAVKETKFGERVREVIVVYDETPDKVKLITVHPLKSYQKHQRINKGRWRKI